MFDIGYFSRHTFFVTGNLFQSQAVIWAAISVQKLIGQLIAWSK